MRENKILFIDDMSDWRRTMLRTFKDKGVDILVAEDAPEGIAMMDRAGVIICDGLGGGCKEVYAAVDGVAEERRPSFMLFSGDWNMQSWANLTQVPAIDKVAFDAVNKVRDWAIEEIKRRAGNN